MKLYKQTIVHFKDLESSYKSKKYSKLAISKYQNILPLVSSPELARVVACLLTDGFMDIRKRGKSIYYGYIGFFSKNERELMDFEKQFYKVFGVKGKIRDWGKRNTGKSKGYIVTNSIINRILHIAGVPGGDKVNQEYSFPDWIMSSNIETKKSFLRQLFDCEGSLHYSNNRKRWELKYSMYKSRNLINDCRNFLNNIRAMLRSFSIDSSLQLKGSYIRNKDKLPVTGLCIRIDHKKYIEKFAEYMGFRVSRKKKKLEALIKKWAR